MAETRSGRALRWFFGDEGTVAAESEMHVVMVATGLALAGIYAMSPVLSALTGPLAVSDARVGAVITAYTVPSVVLVPFIGLAADRFGRRWLLVGGLACLGIGGLAVVLTTDFAVVLALRALQGVGLAAVNTLGVTIIGDLFEGSRETTAQGLRVASIQVAALAFPPIAGVLVIVAWQLPFLLFGLALPVAAWAWYALPAAPETYEGQSLAAYARDLGALLRQPALAAIQLSFVIRFALAVGYLAYISILLVRVLGSSSVAAGLVVSGVGLLALVGSSQVGRLVASRGSLPVLMAGLLATGAGVAALGMSRSYLAVGVSGVLLGTGIGTSGPVQKSLVTQLSPAPLRGGSVSSAILFQSIGQAAGPLVLGWLVAWVGVSTAFVAFGVVGSVVAAVLVGTAVRSSRPTVDG